MNYINELSELNNWFVWYDIQVAQYNRCLRLNIQFDGDIVALDTEATSKQMRIREIKDILGV